MVDLFMECALVTQRIQALHEAARRQRLVQTARTPRAADRPVARVVPLRRAKELRRERA